MSNSRSSVFPGPAGEGRDTFANALRAVRTHMDMEVAFISEFVDGRRFFRAVDAESWFDSVRPGMSSPLEESVCGQVVDGRIPGLMHDALADPVASTFVAVQALGVRAHLSVPIHLSDGRVFGTFCCFSSSPGYALTDRDLQVMRAFAEVVGRQVEKDLVAQEGLEDSRRRIESVLVDDSIRTVYQPICRVSSEQIVGFEALSRFGHEPQRTPDLWFAEARQVGLGIDLEVHAIRLAIRGLARLPRSIYVSVNASPATVESDALAEALRDVPLDRVVVEITEHEAIERYETLAEALRPLQARGLRLAIDDAGAGYACFRHILNLAPHMVKLDVSITRNIHLDRSRRALAAALCRFTEEIGCKIVAEGVENELELQALQRVGFDKVQGFYMGRPVPIDEAVQQARRAAVPCVADAGRRRRQASG